MELVSRSQVTSHKCLDFLKPHDYWLRHLLKIYFLGYNNGSFLDHIVTFWLVLVLKFSPQPDTSNIKKTKQWPFVCFTQTNNSCWLFCVELVPFVLPSLKHWCWNRDSHLNSGALSEHPHRALDAEVWRCRNTLRFVLKEPRRHTATSRWIIYCL